MKKRNTILAAAFVGLFALGSATEYGATWRDTEAPSFEADVPSATLTYTANGEQASIITDSGEIVHDSQIDLITDDDWRTLAETYRLAKPVTVEAETHGKIGIARWQFQISSLGHRGFPSHLFPTQTSWEDGWGSHLELTDDYNTYPLLESANRDTSRIEFVESPSECTTDLLDADPDPKKSAIPEYLSSPVDPSRAVDESQIYDYLEVVGVGEDDTRVQNFCVLIELSPTEGDSGTHTNTVTVSGSSSETGEDVRDSDDWSAGVVPGPADYTQELDAQIASGGVSISGHLVPGMYDQISHDSTTEYFNDGDFDYRDYLEEGRQ